MVEKKGRVAVENVVDELFKFLDSEDPDIKRIAIEYILERLNG